MKFQHWLPGLLVTLTLCACGDRVDDRQRRSTAEGGPGSVQTTDAPSPPTASNEELLELVEEEPVIVPGVQDGTEWFGAIRALRVDPSTGHLLTLDRQVGRVAEFTPSGRLIRRYGGPGGQGPREVLRATSFTFSDSMLFVLDRGNRKVLVYDRETGYRSNFPVQPWHLSIALSGTRLFLVPGRDGHAMDVYSMDGEEVGSVGDAHSLPAGASDTAVRDHLDRPMCGGCQLLALPGGTLLAAGTESAILVHYSDEGEVLRRIELFEDNELLARWRAEDEDHLRTMQQEARERSTSSHRVRVLKRYVNGFSVDTDGQIAATVIPSADVFESRGYEYWIFDPPSFSHRRYGYPRPDVGYYATGDGESVYALDTEDGGIHRFRIRR